MKLSSQILVQENDYIKAGMPLSDGSITPDDILNIKGPSAVQQYLVNEVQEVYRLQGVKINDKHFEVVVRQMMRKVRIIDSGDTLFLEDQLVHKSDFIEQNDEILKIENRIKTTEEQTTMYETKVDAHNKTLDRVKDEIKVSGSRAHSKVRTIRVR